jgi:hypothetical protein
MHLITVLPKRDMKFKILHGRCGQNYSSVSINFHLSAQPNEVLWGVENTHFVIIIIIVTMTKQKKRCKNVLWKTRKYLNFIETGKLDRWTKLNENSLDLSIHGCTALVDIDRFFSCLIHKESAGLLGRGFRPSQGRYLHAEQRKYRINAHRHPCLEWDSNPRSQCSSGRRRFMP